MVNIQQVKHECNYYSTCSCTTGPHKLLPFSGIMKQCLILKCVLVLLTAQLTSSWPPCSLCWWQFRAWLLLSGVSNCLTSLWWSSPAPRTTLTSPPAVKVVNQIDQIIQWILYRPFTTHGKVYVRLIIGLQQWTLDGNDHVLTCREASGQNVCSVNNVCVVQPIINTSVMSIIYNEQTKSHTDNICAYMYTQIDRQTDRHTHIYIHNMTYKHTHTHTHTHNYLCYTMHSSQLRVKVSTVRVPLHHNVDQMLQ